MTKAGLTHIIKTTIEQEKRRGDELAKMVKKIDLV